MYALLQNFTGLDEYIFIIFQVIFWIDILVAFNTGVVKTSNLERDHKQIAIQYLKSYLILDLLAAFPFDKIAESMDPSMWITSIFQLMKLLRFSRCIKYLMLQPLNFALFLFV